MAGVGLTLSIIDSLSVKILESCKEGFSPITHLIDKTNPRTKVHNRKKRLLKMGLLETRGRNQYHATDQGLLALEKALGEAPQGLAKVYPPLSLVPSPYHQAVIELAIASVIARKYGLRTDKHLGILVMGQTLKFKTGSGVFLCDVLGLDPATHVVNLGAEAGRSMFVRRKSTGAVLTRRELMDSCLSVLDEFENADAETKRFIRGVWLDGRRSLPYENTTLDVLAVPYLTMNPSEGKTLEDRTGLSTALIRRLIILDLTNITLPDLAVKGEQILRAAKAHAPLKLTAPKGNCEQYRTNVDNVLTITLQESARKLVDQDSILMLMTALTSYLEPLEAARLILHDLHMVWQTLGWTQAHWMMHIKSFPDPIPKETRIEAPAPNRDRESMPHKTLVKAFEHMETGSSSAELITKLGLTYEQAKLVTNMYAEVLQRQVQIATLEREKEEVTAKIEASKELATLMANMAIIQEGGSARMKVCEYFHDDCCDQYGWKDKPTDTHPPGEVFFKDGWWVMRPDPITCAACSMFVDPNVVMEYQLDEKTSEISQTIESVKKRLDGSPTQDMRDRFTCKSCGAKGFVAVRIHCTKCAREEWWGWYPS
jgi:hypothetical protein